MRKLVTIQIINGVFPIDGADSIEVVKVLGWYVVVKKNEFKVGDKVVYAEIDSVFPNKPEFEFLSKCKFRIKTIKLRGQISQGICFPLNILPDGVYEEGDEVTDILGVTKYEPPTSVCLLEEYRSNFPSFLTKTDQTRVQVLQEKLTKYKGTRCVITEKVDGTSSTYYLNEGKFGVCSRRWELDFDKNSAYWKIVLKYDLENKIRTLGRNIAIQGEIIGPGIQKNKYKLKDFEFYIFDIFDIDTQKYLGYEDFMDIVLKLQLKIVPVLDIDFDLIDNIDELVDMSKGHSLLHPEIFREGVVIKAYEGLTEITGFRVSCKAINPEYLLKFKE